MTKLNDIKFKIMSYCSGCYKIKLSEGVWINRTDDPRVYDLLIDYYSEKNSDDRRLSHGACSRECMKKVWIN